MPKQQPVILDAVEDGSKNAHRRFKRFRVKEVGVVDAGANGREFLIVKRRNDMTVKAKTKDLMGDGKPVITSTADAPGATEEPTTELTVMKARELVADVDLKLAAARDMKEVTVFKSVAPEQFSMFGAMAEALDFCMGTMSMIRNDLVLFVASNGTTGFMGEVVVKEANVTKRLEDARDELAAQLVAAAKGSLAVEVEALKAGKKMASGRLGKLKNVVKELSDLLLELDGEPVKKEAGVKTTADTGTPKGEPAAAAADAPPVVAAPAVTAAAPTTEEVIAKALLKNNEAVTEAVTKAVKPLEDRLAALEKAPAKPAAEAAEGTEEVDAKKKKGASLFAGVL